MPEALQRIDALLFSFGRCHSFPRFATVNDCRVHLEFAKDPEDWTLDILTPMDSWEKSLCTFDALTMFDLFLGPGWFSHILEPRMGGRPPNSLISTARKDENIRES